MPVNKERINEERIDSYTFSENRKIITHDHHGVSGLANISHCTFSPEDATTLHYHSDILEFHCIVKGQRSISVVTGGTMTEYTAKGNELMITYPFELHETANRAKNRNEFYAIQVNIRKGLSLLGLNEEYSNLLRQELLSIPHRHLKVGNAQINMLRTAFNLFAYGSPDDIHLGVANLICFLFSLKYLEPAEVKHTTIANEAIQKALLYISENVEKPISLQDLATISGYSLSHFKYKFKEYLGITPAEYISMQKISLAERELLSSDISITDLAYKLSFSSSNYFCTVFKRVLGYNPSEYRKLFRD